jgi:hypothetical protein
MARKSVQMTLRARLALRKAAGFALVFLCALLCFGSGGKAAVVSPAAVAAYSHTKLSSRFAIADFDGDSRPDLATVEIGQTGASRARYWIGFQLSTGAPQRIGVSAPIGGLDIVSRDVNGDHSLDLIVTTTWLNRPVAVLLNDGHGNFTLTDPAAFPTLVWSAEKIWNVGRLDVTDTAIAVLPRAGGDCSPTDRISEPSAVREPLAAELARHQAFHLTTSALGRAPPFVLHV